ncbi:TonB-dependent receptor [Thermonema rossianum]|uniref:TonB-dependent receptor n=1 Tax=Thermonema rossianum TaxID=55505 RepID=UPI000B11B607|nr:TonB-dependent receptor [Thermonema rossianum]
MMRLNVFFSVLLLFLSAYAAEAQQPAQTSVLRGTVTDARSNAPLPGVSVFLPDLNIGSASDENGRFEVTGIPPGLHTVVFSFVGYQEQRIEDVRFTSAAPAVLNVALEPETIGLDEVTVTVDRALETNEEAPLSLKRISSTEVGRFPGANRDISRVMRALPGVASTPSFRNDLIIRGGAPNETRFYLDGIEIPNINHFATQGANGGPVGLININLIDGVNFYSGAFPATRGNLLSGLLELEQKQPRLDEWAFTGIVSATDAGLVAEGPLGERTGISLSVRRSYLQFLFDALELPFLPTYNDYQLKLQHDFSPKDRFTLISVGALDRFRLNLDANETPEQRYLLDNLPVYGQWNYTIGGKYEHFRKDGNYTLVVSRSMRENAFYKYPDNDESKPKSIDYVSQEIENKLRFEDVRYRGAWTIRYGAGYELAKYNNRSRYTLATANGQVPVDVNSELKMNKVAIFSQVTRTFGEKWSVSAGLRTDFNDYSRDMNRPLEQLSPRLAVAYSFAPRWQWSASVGRYYQLPAYTVMGYRAPDGRLVNRDNGLTYIRSDQAATGFAFLLPERKARITLEAFYKRYDRYPFSVAQGVSLANLGSDFNVVGNEEVTPTSEGRAYGVEFLYQQRLFKGVYGLLAYTFFRSEFTDAQGVYQPSAWDFRHSLSLTAGWRFGKAWELSGRFLFSGGAPYTPYDLEASALKANWDANKQGVPDYSRLNSERTSDFHQLDVRLTKQFYFNRWSLELYLDIQNLYGYKVRLRDNFDVLRDDQGQPLTDPNNPQAYQYQLLKNESGVTLPSIGVVVDF